jgi:hypothetical protein
LYGYNTEPSGYSAKLNMNKNTLSVEQLNALITYAHRNGRRWKSELNYAWMSGNYCDSRDIACYLQSVRNQFGPSWLVKFSFKKA